MMRDNQRNDLVVVIVAKKQEQWMEYAILYQFTEVFAGFVGWNDTVMSMIEQGNIITMISKDRIEGHIQYKAPMFLPFVK